MEIAGLHVIDIVIIVFYLLVSFAVGIYFTKKASKDAESFFLGGRSLPWYLVGLSMVATTFAADTPLTVTEIVTQNGVSGNWLWWNFVMGGMLTTFFFAKLWRRAGILTEVEFITLRYGGKAALWLRKFKAVYLGFFMNVLVIAWVNVAMMTLFEGFFGFDKRSQLLFTAFLMILVAVYASLSGLLGVVYTDALQFILAMAGCIVLAIIIVNAPEIGGMSGLKSKLTPEQWQFLPSFNNPQNITGNLVLGFGSFFAYIGVMWWSSWYPGAEPGGGGYIAQRMMSAKTEKDAVFATLFFQIAHYCIRPWPWIITALCAVVLYPELSSNPKMSYVQAMKDYLPVGLKGLMLVSFLSAYMSTISTQLNWGAGYLVNDFFMLNEKKDDKKLIRYSRFSTLFLMLVGLALSSQIHSIKAVWEFILECGAGLGLVLILRWYWWRINVWSEIAATLTPVLVYAGIKITALYQPNLIWVVFPGSFFLIVSITTLAWLIVTFITKPEKKEVLTNFYNRVRPGGNWKGVENEERIGDKENTANTKSLVLAWILGVLIVYCSLFLIGKFLFLEYSEAIWLFIFLIACIFIFVRLIRNNRNIL
jgi:Na+/proline symporter